MVRDWKTRRLSRRYLVALVGLLGLLALYVTSSGAVLTACTTSSVLTGSNFEIDTNANLKVDGSALCTDWQAVQADVDTQNDLLTGSGDNSFGQGSAENDANPTIVDGSIPPNKSDLKVFDIYTETTASGKFLELFWARINSPQGTTNMDFELNQKFCDLGATPTNCADNGNNFPAQTPLRTSGDMT